MKDTLKSVGSFILGICIFVGVIFLAMMFVKGGVWLSEWIYPWLVVITAIALLVIILVLLPLAIFRRTRAFAGGGIYIASFVFGLTLWVWSLLTSYTLWGIGGVVVGLFLAGVGVVPIAILASLFHGLWSMVGELLLVTAITFGTRFFGIYLMTKAEESGVVVRDIFGAASDSYSAAHDAIQSYTTRANHRHAIFWLRYDLYKSSLDDSNAAAAYDEAVAAYTDPADFAPYTEAELDAHTAAMENLTAAFDTLSAAFAAFNPDDDLYASAADLYKVYCETYTFAAAAYGHAASCAMTTALEGNVQAARDNFQITLLETKAAYAAAADAATAKAKATTFKAKAVEDATKSKVLEQKARVAEAKAEAFLSKGKSVAAIAEKTLAASQ